jgi:hypothetical protein
VDENLVLWRGRSGDDAAIIAALASGATEEEAGARGGVSDRTVRRRLKDPAFREAVERARAESLQAVNEGLRGLAARAVSTLGDLMDDSNPPAVRLGAARTVVAEVVRFQQTVGFQEQLDRIETALGLDAIDVPAR